MLVQPVLSLNRFPILFWREKQKEGNTPLGVILKKKHFCLGFYCPDTATVLACPAGILLYDDVVLDLRVRSLDFDRFQPYQLCIALRKP
jgi:hypothetical protein